jgi:hypothetical protein
VRPGDACTLCFPGATGPEDCGLVWQVMQDADLRARLSELRAEHQAEQRDEQRAALAGRQAGRSRP